MSSTPWTLLVSAIHASANRAVVAVTGGGSKAISQLLEVPGASRTLLEGVVPYSQPALTEWLGGTPEQSCSERTARGMAMAAWMRARTLAADADPVELIGLGLTASLASDRPKKGEHRVHVGLQSAMVTSTMTLRLGKGLRDRKKEEWLAAKMLLITLGEACGVPTEDALSALQAQLEAQEQIERTNQEAPAPWTELLLGKGDLHQPTVEGHNLLTAVPVVFPGAFNPLHTGHLKMVEVASKRLSQPVCLEISLTNVDKLPLDFIEIAARLESVRTIAGDLPLLLTNAPTFQAKSLLFPGCTFVVGLDTLQRIADPQYYTDKASGLEAAIQAFEQRSCRFLVFGRQTDEGFQVLSDLAIPDALAALCDGVPADQFREDISSTLLRKQMQQSQ